MLVLAYDNTAGDNQVSTDCFKKYFLPRSKIENYNIEIDPRNLDDQPINDSIKQYDDIKKISTGDGWLHDWLFIGFCLFWKKLQTNCSWSKQTKNFGCWFESNPPMIFTDIVKPTAKIYYILKQSKETMLELFKETTIVF